MRFTEALLLLIVVVFVVVVLQSLVVKVLNIVLMAFAGATGQSIVVEYGWIVPTVISTIVVAVVVVFVASLIQLIRREEK